MFLVCINVESMYVQYIRAEQTANIFSVFHKILYNTQKIDETPLDKKLEISPWPSSPVLNRDHLLRVELQAGQVGPGHVEVAHVASKLLDLTLDCIVGLNLTLTPGQEASYTVYCG